MIWKLTIFYLKILNIIQAVRELGERKERLQRSIYTNNQFSKDEFQNKFKVKYIKNFTC